MGVRPPAATDLPAACSSSEPKLPQARLRRLHPLAWALIFACRSADGPDAVADRFVDAYFVEADFDRALPLTRGAATGRVEEDRTRALAVRAATSLDEAKPRVYYEKPERRAVGEAMMHHSYTLEIHAGGEPLERRVLVMTARDDRGWRVMSFRELDGTTPPSDSEPGDPLPSGVRTMTRTSTRGGHGP